MQHIFDYILKNKEWIFSGIGVLVLSAIFVLVRWLFFRGSSQIENDAGGESSGSQPVGESGPDHWQGIRPPGSKYATVTETASSIPGGLQSFSFEYGSRGHAYPLTLKGTTARVEIQFTCRIIDPYKAMFGANEYPLNVLRPRFLSQARGVLERFSLTKLREGRETVAREIMAELSPQFEELGFQLESVTIGAIEKLEHA